MPEKHFCVHGHFYQPPRVDPFTGEIPQEYGAEPYGNWTEKIYHSCYLPNANAGNFEKISFNIGSTLTHWMEREHPETLQAIVSQVNTVEKRLGISNGMAQPYYHIIMPLSNRRDKTTLVRWGLHDFKRLFGHLPQGMWLPETAMDLESLDVLAEEGLQFTILAPWQAKHPDLDVTRPYRVELPSGRSMGVFFYNSFLSGEISFNPAATENADRFVHDWLQPQMAFVQREGAQFYMAASDGELYGHHQPYRDMFLARLLDGAVESQGILHDYPAGWLRDHPLDQTTEVLENTSWSCHHGIERWRDVCGDAPDATWKKPLRDFLSGLCEAVDQVFVELSDGLFEDPWQARDDYVQVLTDKVNPNEFVHAHAKKDLSADETNMLKNLLAAENERLRMLSSDAWFFYDLDRIEPLNALKYAAHATYLTRLASGKDVSEALLPIISRAESKASGLHGDMAFLSYLSRFQLNY
ncbi:MAG: hypothetical protein PWQ55_715 [Chloroflexota bacterium]|nr:hypothetical protein [Chloroflexota bacterium]